MKFGKARDFGGAELADTIPGEPEAPVYVLTLEIIANGDYVGWTSVHRSPEGARRRIEERVNAAGLHDTYTVARAAEVDDGHCIAFGEEGDPIVYGISRLPVED